jgi:phosphotransacetylase/acyl dehydratase
MIIQNRPLGHLKPGDTAELTRLCTANDLLVFAAATGNHNPMHLPDTDVDGDGHPEAIASGIFLAAMISAVLGNLLPGPGTLYRSQQLTFHGTARAGDTLVARVRVTDVHPDGQVQLATEVLRPLDGQVVLSGQAVVQAPTRAIQFDDADLPGLIVTRHRHFDALIARAKALPPMVTAVVCPEDRPALEGALQAMAHGFVTPILIGNAARIRRVATDSGLSLDGVQVIDSDDPATLAVAEVRAGRAQAVMKGKMHTDDLLRPMMDRDLGLRTRRRMSHVFVLDVPGRDAPLLISDAAVNIAPDLMTKADIVQNAIDLARSIGLATPRVGVLSAVEVVNPAIPSSIDAALLSKMAERGQIKGGLVDGPLAMDNALDLAAARIKGLRGAVAGRADVLIVPDLDAGNMLVKLVTRLAHAEAAGVVLGARVPVILTSRADSAMERLASAAIAAIHAAAGREG